MNYLYIQNYIGTRKSEASIPTYTRHSSGPSQVSSKSLLCIYAGLAFYRFNGEVTSPSGLLLAGPDFYAQACPATDVRLRAVSETIHYSGHAAVQSGPLGKQSSIDTDIMNCKHVLKIDRGLALVHYDVKLSGGAAQPDERVEKRGVAAEFRWHQRAASRRIRRWFFSYTWMIVSIYLGWSNG